MPIGTALHERTFALCESLNYREWSGYYTVSAYESHHEHEYNAIRNAAAPVACVPVVPVPWVPVVPLPWVPVVPVPWVPVVPVP